VISGQPEVELTSETSGLGGSHLVEGSSLVLTRYLSDLDNSLNVASISYLLALGLRLSHFRSTGSRIDV